MTSRVRRLIAATACAVAVISACAGCAIGNSSQAATPISNGYSYVALALGHQLDVHRTPGGPIVKRLANPNTFHDPLVLLATARSGDWIRVLLPTRPNGASGFVPASAVQLRWTPWRVDVDVSAHRLVLYDANRPTMQTEVAVGSPATPTPLGRFYITTLLRQPDPNGAYGPYAFGLSAFSPVLKHFAGGPGEIGLHGTNEPWSIGHSETHGCIRVSNRVITWLAAELPLGTPVVVHR